MFIPLHNWNTVATSESNMNETQKGAALGVDIGWAGRRHTTCLCLLEWSDDVVSFNKFQKVGTHIDARRDALGRVLGQTTHLAAVAIDGPLVRGLRHVSHYRTAEASLSMGIFQKRGKPGPTNAPVGKKLHVNATQFATLILEEAERGHLTVARAAVPKNCWRCFCHVAAFQTIWSA